VPIEYTIRDGVLLARASGRLDDATLMTYCRTVKDDPGYAAASADLFDMRGVELELTGDGLRAVATFIREARISSPVVAIVADAPAAYGMARKIELLRDDIVVKVFQEPHAALTWVRAPSAPEG
jgi:hypothetical protein